MTTKRPRSIRRRPLPIVAPGVPVYEGLRRLGIDTADWDYVVALAGNPNTGKSTVFNSLTGLKQHVGNWPGKTVARAEGGFEYGAKKFKLVDLPGTYSLLSASTDEEIARDFILFGRPDCTIIVVDTTVLERNLNLTLQILEITDRAVLCLNLMDEAERKGVEVDHEHLESDLGIPVIPTVARTGHGIRDLIEAVAGVADGSIVTRPHRIGGYGEAARSVDRLAAMVEAAYPGLPNARWVAMRLLEGDKRVERAIAGGELHELVEAYEMQPAGAGGTG
ncbi:MAG: 50S ribosome-binding GTPase [Gemmatimonadota bacterium]|nr:MAG: 50S ribosome-binding GTPase [Gemmatimonadota bacterium]